MILQAFSLLQKESFKMNSSELYENKKSGTLSQDEMDSTLVDLSVLISNFLS